LVVSLIILALWNIHICYGSVNVEIDQNLLILLETLINSFTNLPTLSFKDTVLWSYLQKKKKTFPTYNFASSSRSLFACSCTCMCRPACSFIALNKGFPNSFTFLFPKWRKSVNRIASSLSLTLRFLLKDHTVNITTYCI